MNRLRMLSLASIAALAAACGGSSEDPPPAACTYAYTAWGTCQPTGTQTRTVTSATPDGCTGTPALSQACQPAVTIDFKAVVGDQAFDCTNLAGYAVGTGTIPLKPRDFRFYVSNLRLVTAAGAEASVTLDTTVWQNFGVALLDFENATGACLVGSAETNTAVTGTAPVGTYVGLRFDLGVPAASNHFDYQSPSMLPPLNNSAMAWSWTTGFKFTKIEVNIQRAAPPAAPFTFNFHLGSSGCGLTTPGDYSTAVCTKLNTPAVDLAAFDPATQAVAFDLAALLAGMNLDSADGGGAPGCMSGETDPECWPTFPHLGLTVNGLPADPQQSVFRAVAK
ncbi:MAG: metallo-mystery pair system four-Cys motif protein [Anaeromyxobacter sp.]|nr:metallo-mystery pair system four-Cys motif protein [Anaeromyxobacter sp.]MBL0277216.1 metallo-mystery pair system four-Cys motif protein [Anaeromyxobacter sp.]